MVNVIRTGHKQNPWLIKGKKIKNLTNCEGKSDATCTWEKGQQWIYMSQGQNEAKKRLIAEVLF